MLNDYKIRHPYVWLALILAIVRGLLGSYGNDTLVITLIINILLFVSLDYRHVKKILLPIVILIPICAIHKSALAIIDIFLFAYFFSKISLRSVIKTNLFILFIAFIVIILLNKLGVLVSEEIEHAKFNNANTRTVTTAYTLGMGNTNSLAGYLFSLLSLIYLMVCDKNKFITPIIFAFAFWGVYLLTSSRTCIISGVILIISHYLFKYRFIGYKFRYFIGCLPIILYLIFFYIIFNIDSFAVIDKILTRRFSIPYEIMQNMSPVNWLIGTSLPEDEPMDSAFMSMIFTGGIPLMLFFIVQFYRTITKYFCDLYSYMPFIIAVVCYGLVENTFSAVSSTSIIFWVLLLTSYFKESNHPNPIYSL